MNRINYRRLSLFLLLVVCAQFAWIWHLTWASGLHQLEAKDTWLFVHDCENTRERLATLKVDEEAAYLDYIVRRNTSSMRVHALGLIAERERALMIHNIIEDLRKKTGDHLGDEPHEWIEKYYKR
jgi:hypothetical protein